MDGVTAAFHDLPAEAYPMKIRYEYGPSGVLREDVIPEPGAYRVPHLEELGLDPEDGKDVSVFISFPDGTTHEISAGDDGLFRVSGDGIDDDTAHRMLMRATASNYDDARYSEALDAMQANGEAPDWGPGERCYSCGRNRASARLWLETRTFEGPTDPASFCFPCMAQLNEFMRAMKRGDAKIVEVDVLTGDEAHWEKTNEELEQEGGAYD